MRRRRAADRWATLRLPLLLFTACAKPAAVVAPPPPPSLAPPTAPSPARPVSVWRPSVIPPQITQATFTQESPEGLVVIDDVGARWLFPRDGTAPRGVEVLDVLPLVTWRWDDALGLIATSGETHVYASKTALGPLGSIATLPEGSDPETFAHLEGVRTVRGKSGLLASSDGLVWSPVPGLGGYDPQQIVLDARGNGVGLFAPETVALTKDRGVTWTPLPTAELTVKRLTTFEGKPVLAPAGRRDPFERSVDLDRGALGRVFVPRALSPLQKRDAAKARGVVLTAKGHALEYRHPRTAKGKPPPPPPSSSSAGTREPVRLDLDSDEYDALLAATDGERVLALPSTGLRMQHPGTAPLVGKLGEGGVPLGGEELAECRSSSGALCGDLIALSCGKYVAVYRENREIARFPSKHETAVGFDAEGHLLSFSRDRTAKRSTLARYDFDALPPTVHETPLPDIPASPPVFVGGCRKPALWLVGAEHAARWEGDAFGSPVSVPDRLPAAGVNHERELVFPSPARRALTFLPSGRKLEVGAFWRGVSFSEDGHHALVTHLPRRLLASHDGGHSFHPIPAPAGHTSSVLCGKERCQLGTGAYRDGFVEDDGFVPLPATLPAADPPPPSPPPPKSFPRVMSCAIDPAVFQGIPVASAGLSPRVGSAAFSGLATDEATRRQAIFADVTGHANVIALPPPPPGRRDPGDEEELLAEGMPAISHRTEGHDYAQVETRYRWDAASPLRRFFEPHTWRTALAWPDLFSEQGLAAHFHPGRLLVWGSSAPKERPFPTATAREGAGVFVEDAAGTLHVAQERDDTTLRLVVAPREGAPLERTLVARRHAVRENAVGLLPPTSPGDPWSVILSEIVEDEASELRIHPLGADLSLGPPIVVPRTRAPADHLMELPSCGPSPSGALVRTLTKTRASIQEGDAPANGHLQRLLRVTAQSACVERTFLATDRTGLAGSIVVVGNGGLGSGRHHVGLQCEPVITTPLPRATTE